MGRGMNEPLIVNIPGTVTLMHSPNGRAHWRTKHKLTAELRYTARMATIEAVGGDPNVCYPFPSYPIRLDYTVGWESRRRHFWDDDNFIGAAKLIRDAIASVLGIDDRHFITGSVTQEYDPAKRGYILVRIASVAEEAAA
jgi:hypothetical protein